MKKPTRRAARLAAAVNSAQAPTALQLENAPMSDIIHALAGGRVTATALTEGYLARIRAYDRDGLKSSPHTYPVRCGGIKPAARR